MGAEDNVIVKPQKTKLEFDEWVSHIFDHDAPEIVTYEEIMDEIEWDGFAEQKIAYMAQLFERPRPILDPYSDLQLQHGFEYLISNLLSDYPLGLHDSSVPLDLRAHCIRNMYTVFDRVFAVRCSPELACSGRRSASRLNDTCYMWWDILAFGSKSVPIQDRILDETALTVMELTLCLESLPCQEGALHGLGHWYHDYPERVRATIGDYLERNSAMPTELRAYAQNARRGYVQ